MSAARRSGPAPMRAVAVAMSTACSSESSKRQAHADHAHRVPRALYSGAGDVTRSGCAAVQLAELGNHGRADEEILRRIEREPVARCRGAGTNGRLERDRTTRDDAERELGADRVEAVALGGAAVHRVG